jgi:hypothetical protein
MYGIMGLRKGGKPTSRGKGVKYSKAKKKQLAGIKKSIAGKKSSQQLDRIVRQGKQDQDYRSGFSSPSTVIGGMTQKQQDFIARNRRKDGSLNSAAQSVLDFYSDDRSDYQRDLNKFIKSSPGARKAYLDRFPIGGALNLGIPAAFKALAPAPLKMIGDLAKYAQSGLTNIVPEQIRKDMGPGVQKLWGDVKDAPGNLLRDAKGMLTGKLDQNQIGLINTIKDDKQTAKEDLIEGEKTLEDTEQSLAKEILFGMDDGAATETVDAAQNIAYDPTRPINYASEASGEPPNKNPFSPGDELDNLLIENELDTRLAETMDVGEREDIFDPSQNVMPHVPISLEQKMDEISKVYDWNRARMDEDLDDTEYYGDYWRDAYHNMYETLREKQDQGMTYGTRGSGLGEGFQGVINRSYWPEWQRPGTAELVNQINWNTANRPLDWSGGETPELTEDFIKENITTDWGFDQGGYLKKYDDGGYANMSTFEKLKAINDSIAEG